MKLQSLIIQNFESWENQQFNFDPGVNIFVGLSDTGKSAVLRALRWVIENKPTGDKCRSDFADKKAITKCTLQFDDNIFISRVRGNSENKYLLTKDGKTQTFEAFNTAVPDEIAEAINLTSLNIQRQIELPFLLAQNPPDRGRFFNEIAGLDKIDSSQKYANSKVLEQSRECASCEKEIERVEDELSELDFIPTLEQKIKELSESQKQADILKIKRDSIKSIFSKWQSTKAELEEAEKIDIEAISKKIKSALLQIIDYRKQKEHIQKIKNIWNSFCQTQDELSDVQTINFQEINQKIKTELQHIVEYRKERIKQRQIKHLFEEYRDTQGKLLKTEKTLASTFVAYNAAKPDICPLCKREGWKNG